MTTIVRKKPRTTVLYARVKKENNDWLRSAAKKLGYSISEFMDLCLEKLRSDDRSAK